VVCLQVVPRCSVESVWLKGVVCLQVVPRCSVVSVWLKGVVCLQVVPRCSGATGSGSFVDSAARGQFLGATE